MGDGATAEEVFELVDRAAAELLAAVGASAPPVDALSLVQRHFGLEVRTGAASPRSRKGGSALVLDPEWSEEQRQWAAARAAGERLKPELVRRLAISSDEESSLGGASLVNLFATRLLLPTAWFAADAAACGFDLLELKRRFATASHEMLAWRMLDLPTPCVVTIIDDGKVARRRSSGGRVPRTLNLAELECVELVLADDRPHLIRSGAWTVQGWPVPREYGRRVILRSVGDDG
jgi:predicted transcriptional regulator